jgi:zinc protease
MLFAVALPALLAVALPAIAAEQASTVDAILAKYINAMGGKAAMEKIKTRTCKGRLEIPAMSVGSEWDFSGKAPNKQVTNWELSGSGMITDGFDGATAWAKSPVDGLRVKKGDELAKVKRDAEFYRELKMRSLYPDLAYKGSEALEGDAVQVLESKPSASSKERFSFSSKTGLLVRQQSEFDGPQGRVRANARMFDFRPVEGVLYPHLLKCDLQIGDQKFEFSIKLAEIKHNLPVADTVFAKPAS